MLFSFVLASVALTPGLIRPRGAVAMLCVNNPRRDMHMRSEATILTFSLSPSHQLD